MILVLDSFVHGVQFSGGTCEQVMGAISRTAHSERLAAANELEVAQ
jgi:hypothetical protein